MKHMGVGISINDGKWKCCKCTLSLYMDIRTLSYVTYTHTNTGYQNNIRDFYSRSRDKKLGEKPEEYLKHLISFTINCETF